MQQYIIRPDGRKSAATEVTCSYCEQVFLKSSYVLRARKSSKTFCSNVCKGKASQNRVKVKCEMCNCFFERRKSRIQRKKVSGLHFCSRVCKDIAQRLSSNIELRPKSYTNGYSVYRKIAFESKRKQCERCGNDNEIVLCVHHKDRNRENNSIDNLEVLCYNCHAIEHKNNGV